MVYIHFNHFCDGCANLIPRGDERGRVISIVEDINFSMTSMDRPNSDYDKTTCLFYKCVILIAFGEFYISAIYLTDDLE